MAAGSNSDRGHNEDDGQLKDSLDAAQAGIAHSQLRYPVGARLITKQLAENLDLVWQQDSKSLNRQDSGNGKGGYKSLFR